MDLSKSEWWTVLIAAGAFVVALISAAIALAAFISGRRDARRAREEAATASATAHQALGIARAQASSQDSMAASLEQLTGRTTSMEDVFDQYFGKRSAEWEIIHRKGATYDIQNVGNASAYEVQVTCANAVRFDELPETPEWKPGSAQTIFAAGSLQTGTPVVSIRWRSTPIDPKLQEWSRPVPPQR